MTDGDEGLPELPVMDQTEAEILSEKAIIQWDVPDCICPINKKTKQIKTKKGQSRSEVPKCYARTHLDVLKKKKEWKMEVEIRIQYPSNMLIQ